MVRESGHRFAKDLTQQIALALVVVLLPMLFASGSSANPLEGYYTEEEVRTQIEGEVDDVLIRKSWYTGKMMYKDEQWQGITIARMDKDTIYILDPHMKSYFSITPEFLRKNIATQLQLFGAMNGPDGQYFFPEDLFVRTGTTKQIGSWACYQVMTNPKYRSPEKPYMLFWYSAEVDFPVQVFGQQLRNFFGDSPEVQGLFDRISKFEGYPVRTEAHGLTSTVVTTLIKLQPRKDIDPNLFEVPSGFTHFPLSENIPPQQWGQ